jgi:hypothetical protein
LLQNATIGEKYGQKKKKESKEEKEIKVSTSGEKINCFGGPWTSLSF